MAKTKKRLSLRTFGKSRSGDYSLATDESAPLGERTSALFRLAVDGDPRVLPLTREWLTRPEAHLREEAIGRLLFGNAPDALGTAIERLYRDPEPSVRCGVAASLGGYLRLHPEASVVIAAAFADRLRRDEDTIVQRACYEILPQEFAAPTNRVPFDFDARADVDWAWVDRLFPPSRTP